MYEKISLPIFLKVKLTKIFQGQSSLNATNTKFFSITDPAVKITSVKAL